MGEKERRGILQRVKVGKDLEIQVCCEKNFILTASLKFISCHPTTTRGLFVL